jgi:hypothetical protein
MYAAKTMGALPSDAKRALAYSLVIGFIPVVGALAALSIIRGG